MKKITYKEKGMEIKNPSPFLVVILRIQKQREEMARIRAQKGIKDFALKLDKEIMRMGT